MEKTLRKYFPIFVLPTLAAFIIGFIIPFSEGIYLSFSRFTTVLNAQFVGVENFARAFQDESFRHSFLFTGGFALLATFLINTLAFMVALILTKKFRGTTVFRSIFFMPNLIGGIVLGYIWQILINAVLSAAAKPLLAVNATAGFWGLIILMCWQQIGYMMIIYVAGLKGIPGEMDEAVKIDGASSWQALWKVKIPMLMPTFTICLFLSITNSFKLFDQNLALTAGEPLISSIRRTEMIALNIYNTFYARAGAQWKGLGQAKAMIFFVLVLVLSVAQLRITRSREVQQ